MIYLNGTIVNTTRFPDNTSQVWKTNIDSFKDKGIVSVRWRYTHEAEILELAQLKALIDHYKLNCTLVIDYLPYARQDKEISNEATFGLITFAKILNSLNFPVVLIKDPHSYKALSLINNSRDFYPKAELEDIWKETNSDIICYPDSGATSKYTSIYDFPSTSANKVRNQLTGNIEGIELNEPGIVANKKVLIVDDICDGGGTFIGLAKLLLTNGAKEVNLFVTHGLFTKGLRPLKDAGITGVYTPTGKYKIYMEN